MKGNNRTQCRILKRCFLFFATISLLPLGIVYLVTTDAVSYRIKNFEVCTIFFLLIYRSYNTSLTDILCTFKKKNLLKVIPFMLVKHIGASLFLAPTKPIEKFLSKIDKDM